MMFFMKLYGQFLIKMHVSIIEYKKSYMLSFFQENKEVLEGAVSNEKTLSIYKLIMNGGLGGQIILTILFVLLTIALYIYFERFFAIKAKQPAPKKQTGVKA